MGIGISRDEYEDEQREWEARIAELELERSKRVYTWTQRMVEKDKRIDELEAALGNVIHNAGRHVLGTCVDCCSAKDVAREALEGDSYE